MWKHNMGTLSDWSEGSACQSDWCTPHKRTKGVPEARRELLCQSLPRLHLWEKSSKPQLLTTLICLAFFCFVFFFILSILFHKGNEYIVLFICYAHKANTKKSGNKTTWWGCSKCTGHYCFNDEVFLKGSSTGKKA